MNYLMLYLEDRYSLTSEKKIQKALSIIADCDKYHPIRDYLNSLQWDGTERIRYALPRFLGAEESEYTYECLRLFMLGAISRVFKPGCKFEVMLCLVGGQEQLKLLIRDIMETGIKVKDASHVASTVLAGCEFFLTTDKRLLK